MQVVPYTISSGRILIVVPNKLLRDQIVDEFKTGAKLAELGILEKSLVGCKAIGIEHRIKEASDWQNLEAYDVAVATPQCISPSLDDIVPPPDGLFDTVFFDEAHHTAAPSWYATLSALKSARIAMFTATPFRRDRKAVPGTLVYDYPMTRAIGEGLIAPLQLRVIEFDDIGDPDAALVAEIARLVGPDGGDYAGVPFLARTNSVDHARTLVKQYEAAGLRVGLVLGDHSLTHARRVIKSFKDREKQGLIMVGTLGEGFDYPNVKIAAYHRRHKSLPATLQFFGRISRVNADRVVHPLVLVPAHDVADETAVLYSHSADWGKLVPALADSAIEAERQERAFHLEYSDSVKGVVPSTALIPAKVVDIFEIPDANDICFDLAKLPQKAGVARLDKFGGTDHDFCAFILMNDASPKWIASDILIERTFELIAAVYDAENRLLIVSSPTHARSAEYARIFGATEIRRLAPERLYGLLKRHDVQTYFNVGIRSVETPSELRPAYKNSSGRSVEFSLTQVEKDNYSLGHALARYKGTDGAYHVFGISVKKSRIWMPEATQGLGAFITWCKELAALLASVMPEHGAPLLGLRNVQPFAEFPDNPVLATFGQRMIEEDLYFQSVGKERYACFELNPVASVSQDKKTCSVALKFENDIIATVTYDANGKASVATDMQLRTGTSLDPIDADAAFSHDPITMYYADGSSTQSFLLSLASDNVPAFPTMKIRHFDWQGVRISQERSDPENGVVGIFEHLETQLKTEFPLALIVNDDGGGEIADVIVIQDKSQKKIVRFYHCKGARGAGSNLRDLYEVIGQAQRSTRWANPQIFWPEAYKRLGVRFRLVAASSGEENARMRLKEWAEAPPLTEFEVYIVQPGIAADQLEPGDNVSRFLVLCQQLVESYNTNFGMICSATAPRYDTEPEGV